MSAAQSHQLVQQLTLLTLLLVLSPLADDSPGGDRARAVGDGLARRDFLGSRPTRGPLFIPFPQVNLNNH